jgi:hypothetical protein
LEEDEEENIEGDTVEPKVVALEVAVAIVEKSMA